MSLGEPHSELDANLALQFSLITDMALVTKLYLREPQYDNISQQPMSLKSLDPELWLSCLNLNSTHNFLAQHNHKANLMLRPPSHTRASARNSLFLRIFLKISVSSSRASSSPALVPTAASGEVEVVAAAPAPVWGAWPGRDPRKAEELHRKKTAFLKQGVSVHSLPSLLQDVAEIK
ncbi:hypothetical protein A6R68_14510 [Neotoma lepida]|uniref:Uncharacterized protein n=1 Tax=Neotoma lepida TaxID=56216 RepID=A0A1A6HAM0_NEOLE|nr:hypothetical protein A6R68_14510 [Neotoma lepida]